MLAYFLVDSYIAFIFCFFSTNIQNTWRHESGLHTPFRKTKKPLISSMYLLSKGAAMSDRLPSSTYEPALGPKQSLFLGSSLLYNITFTVTIFLSCQIYKEPRRSRKLRLQKPVLAGLGLRIEVVNNWNVKMLFIFKTSILYLLYEHSCSTECLIQTKKSTYRNNLKCVLQGTHC